MTLAVVLVHTQMPENIGASARAMANFSLSDLRLVKPKTAWPDKKAYDMAASGAFVLDKAALHNTLPDALADRQYVYATTGRDRDITKKILSPRAAAEDMRERIARGEQCAILFGPERTGLENEDIALADCLVTIPTDPEYASLNIAQSVVIMGYEWFARVKSDEYLVVGKKLATRPSSLATKEELQGLFDHLEAELDRVNFWNVEHKKEKMWLHLRSLFTRASLSEQEVRTLRGMVRGLAEGEQTQSPIKKIIHK